MGNFGLDAAGLDFSGAQAAILHDLKKWFPGHGGLAIGLGPVLSVPFGNAAAGRDGEMRKSHSLGYGLELHAGVLFLRQWGVFVHGALLDHFRGESEPKDATSSQLGITGRYILDPERRSYYLEAGFNRSAFTTDVQTVAGRTERSTSAWDLRLGGGYLVLDDKDEFVYSPFVTMDIGQFDSFESNKEPTLKLPDDRQGWHVVVSTGLSFAFHNRQKQLVGETRHPQDLDGDGIPAATDKCPHEMEDNLPPAIHDGCATTDRDGDGFPNDSDTCPTGPEDGLPPVADDGCPSSDPDQDGFIGADDRCPREPETINGIEDDDGCPDEGRVNVSTALGRVTITDKIFFAMNSAEIVHQSLQLVGEVARTVPRLVDVELIEVQGHADDRGADAANIALTQARANAVRDALIDRGVPPSKLTAVGYGAFCPLMPGTDDEARNQNRRVEFRIVRTKKGPTGVETACQNAIDHGIPGSSPDAVGAAAGPSDPGREPSHDEVRATVARSDASLLFPDYYGCPAGEPTIDRLTVFDVRREGDLWVARVDGVIQPAARRLPADCFREERHRKLWESLYGQRTTVKVYLRRRQTTLKVIVP